MKIDQSDPQLKLPQTQNHQKTIRLSEKVLTRCVVRLGLFRMVPEQVVITFVKTMLSLQSCATIVM